MSGNEGHRSTCLLSVGIPTETRYILGIPRYQNRVERWRIGTKAREKEKKNISILYYTIVDYFQATKKFLAANVWEMYEVRIISRHFLFRENATQYH